MGEAKKWGGAHGGPRGFRVELGDVTQEGHRVVGCSRTPPVHPLCAVAKTCKLLHPQTKINFLSFLHLCECMYTFFLSSHGLDIPPESC